MLHCCKNFVLVFCFFWVCFSLSAQNVFLQGVVYEDINKDGKRDSEEPGISGVMVSNQREVVLTDGEGRYKLELTEDCVVFITKPAKYDVPVSKLQLPQFYFLYKKTPSPDLYHKGIAVTQSIPQSLDFGLYRTPKKDNFQILVLADPQTETVQEIDYLRQDLVEEVSGQNMAFGLVLGDIIFDHLDLLNYQNPVMAQMGFPVYNVMGNHDVNYDALDDAHSDETFRRHYGPNYYSFDYGQVHFILLDSVNFFINPEKNKPDYEGRLGERQLQWIRNDLKHVPDDKLVVLCMHIPLDAYTAKGRRDYIVDRNEVYEILKTRKQVLALAGHNHEQEQNFYGQEKGWQGENPLHQIICVALCGAWWGGPLDERGVPLSYQQDGVPNGYYIFSFEGTKYTSSLKISGKCKEYQMQIHSPSGILTREEAKKASILVNVFDHSSKSRTFYSLDGGELIPLENFYDKDPMAVLLYDTDKRGQKPWVRATKTWNLWKAAMPKVEAGIHRLKVQTIDQYGRIFESTRVFWVK